jgi:hypothetical protein
MGRTHNTFFAACHPNRPRICGTLFGNSAITVQGHHTQFALGRENQVRCPQILHPGTFIPLTRYVLSNESMSTRSVSLGKSIAKKYLAGYR